MVLDNFKKFLLERYWRQRNWCRSQLGHINGCKICRLFRATKKILLRKTTLQEGRKELWEQDRVIQPHAEYMILVDTVCQTARPDCAAAKFVKVATLRHYHIAWPKAESLNIFW